MRKFIKTIGVFGGVLALGFLSAHTEKEEGGCAQKQISLSSATSIVVKRDDKYVVEKDWTEIPKHWLKADGNRSDLKVKVPSKLSQAGIKLSIKRAKDFSKVFQLSDASPKEEYIFDLSQNKALHYLDVGESVLFEVYDSKDKLLCSQLMSPDDPH